MKEATNLDLLQSEATAGTNSGVVLDSLAVDGGTELVNRSRGKALSLFNSSAATALLATGLIEPSLDSDLPVLAEMGIRQLVVMLHY